MSPPPTNCDCSGVSLQLTVCDCTGVSPQLTVCDYTGVSPQLAECDYTGVSPQLTVCDCTGVSLPKYVMALVSRSLSVEDVRHMHIFTFCVLHIYE